MALIRRFDPLDTAECCDVINAALDVMDGLNRAAHERVRAKNVPDILGPELGAAFTLVGEVETRIRAVGCLSGSEIKRLYVTPGDHRRGLGRAIAEELEGEGRRSGLSELRVDASPSSVRFYERLGFVTEREDTLERGPAVFRFVVMTKRLG